MATEDAYAMEKRRDANSVGRANSHEAWHLKAGRPMCHGLTGVVGFVIATALGSVSWPFELFCGIGVASFLAGLVIFRTT